MKLVRLFLLAPLMSLTINAQTNNNDFDGPYVMYNNGKTVVKQIIDGKYKDLSSSYASNKLLTCRFPDKSSFSFPLKKKITTDIAEVETLPSSFFVASDMEGEFNAFASLLKKANVINSQYKWNYGKNHLYIIGDMVDRGNSVTELLWLIYKLEDEAKAAGGAVHYILGNHEVMNLYGSYKDVNTKYTNTTLPAMGETMKSIMGTNSELGRWLRSKNVIERYNKVAFVHGGITNEVANFPYTYKEYNDIAKHFIANKGKCNYGDDEKNEQCMAINSSLSRNDGSDTKYSGLYWDRTVAKGDVDKEELDNTLSVMVVNRMIIGHSLQDDINLHSKYGDKVLNIDVYHHAFDKNGEPRYRMTNGLYYGGGCYYNFALDNGVSEYTKLSCTNDHVSAARKGTEEQNISQNLELSISPNPFNHELNINLAAETINASNLATEVKFYNLQGALVKTSYIAPKQNNITLDTSDIAAGEYILHISNGQYTNTQKVLSRK